MKTSATLAAAGSLAALFMVTTPLLVHADHNGLHATPCNAADTVGGGVLGNSPGPVGPPNSLGWDVGSGQCNGSFTVSRDTSFPGGDIELGMRAEERRVGQVTRTGPNDYTVQLGNDPNAPPALNRAWWNFQHSIAYDGDIDDLDKLTFQIITDVGPNPPASPSVDMLPLRPFIDDRNNQPNATSTFSDLYQTSQNPEFGWFAPTEDNDANPNGAFDYDAEGAWRMILSAEKDGRVASVAICVHTPNAACRIPSGSFGSATIVPFFVGSKTTFRLTNNGPDDVDVHLVRVCSAEKSFAGEGFCVASDRETSLTPMQTRVLNVENYFSIDAANCPAGFILAYASIDHPVLGTNTPISWNFLSGSAYFRDSGSGKLRAAGLQAITLTSPRAPLTPIGTGGIFPVLPFDGFNFDPVFTNSVTDFRATSGGGVNKKGSVLNLLTLDIKAGQSNLPTLVALDWNNQAEVSFSGTLEYVCHVRVPLEDIPGAGGSLTAGGMGSQFGQLTITPSGNDAVLGFIEEFENNRATWRRLFHDDQTRTTTFIAR